MTGERRSNRRRRPMTMRRIRVRRSFGRRRRSKSARANAYVDCIAVLAFLHVFPFDADFLISLHRCIDNFVGVLLRCLMMVYVVRLITKR